LVYRKLFTLPGPTFNYISEETPLNEIPISELLTEVVILSDGNIGHFFFDMLMYFYWGAV